MKADVFRLAAESRPTEHLGALCLRKTQTAEA